MRANEIVLINELTHQEAKEELRGARVGHKFSFTYINRGQDRASKLFEVEKINDVEFRVLRIYYKEL